MSHCTKFKFNYSDERAIVKAFHKMNLKCTSSAVCEYNSELAKYILSYFGYLGNKQLRSIIGVSGKYQLFMCRVAENHYELYIERSQIGYNDEVEMKQLADRYKMAYMEVAVDGIIKKLDNSNMPSEVVRQENGFVINFGPTMQYTISVISDNDQIVENVEGVKGDFCTRLTEDIEEILSQPTTELRTEFTEEYNMLVDDQNIQVLNLSF